MVAHECCKRFYLASEQFPHVGETLSHFPPRGRIVLLCRGYTCHGLLVQHMHVPVERFDTLLKPGLPALETVKATINAVKATIDAVETAVNAVESDVDSIEPLPNAVEPDVDSIEPPPNAVELMVNAIEPLFGHKAPQRHDDDTSSRAFVKEQRLCRAEGRTKFRVLIGRSQKST